jgi:hypothetical protein
MEISFASMMQKKREGYVETSFASMMQKKRTW